MVNNYCLILWPTYYPSLNLKSLFPEEDYRVVSDFQELHFRLTDGKCPDTIVIFGSRLPSSTSDLMITLVNRRPEKNWFHPNLKVYVEPGNMSVMDYLTAPGYRAYLRLG